MRVVRLVATLIGVAVVVGMAAFAYDWAFGKHVPAAERQNRTVWDTTHPTNYTFVFSQGGMCGSDSVRIDVRGATPPATTTVSRQCGSLDHEPPFTMEHAFDLLEAAYRRAEKVTAQYDPTFGFPAAVGIDESESAIDDEHGFTITEFTVLP